MDLQIKKLRIIYLPFLGIAVCIIGGYSFLNWLFLIKLQLFSIKELIINFIVPFILPWIPIFIWLNPRIKLLSLKTTKGGDLPFLYQLIATIAIAIPTIVAQEYLTTATGKLTELENISQINNQAITKYYTLKNVFIDKFHIGVHNSFDVSGKHNEYFNMNFFIVLPVFATQSDTSNSDCSAWFGVKYHDQISNHLDEKEKKEKFRRFANQSQNDFDQKNVNQFVYLNRIGNSDDHDGYCEAIKKNHKYKSNTRSGLVLLPVNEPFEARNGNKLEWIFGSLAIGSLVWLIMLIIPKFDPEALERFKNGSIVNNADMKEIFYFFIPKEGFFITPIIMNLNIVVFFIMVFAGVGFISFKSSDLLLWGANYKPSTINGEWWRLITNTFLHGGIMHLFANMIGLVFVGIFLEPHLGKIRFVIVYLCSGIIASIASLWWHNATVSVGASGAIFGLYGVFLALLLAKVFPKEFSKAFLTSTLVFIGFNLLIGFSGGIDTAAHGGGLLSGLVIGIILYPRIKQETAQLMIDEQTKL